MSRFTLSKKVKEGKFPAPVDKCKRGLHMYDEGQVREWMEENLDFIRSRKDRNIKTIEMSFEKLDMMRIKKAAKLLQCDSLEAFIVDAAVWKARKITELTGEEE